MIQSKRGVVLNWTFEGGIPIWWQICEKLRRSIILGEYQPYDRIPGVRELAAEAQVNPNTMQRALAKLEDEGLIVTRATNGRFVSADTEMIRLARKAMVSEAASNYLNKCAEIGISREEAISILQEEGDNIG